MLVRAGDKDGYPFTLDTHDADVASELEELGFIHLGVFMETTTGWLGRAKFKPSDRRLALLTPEGAQAYRVLASERLWNAVIGIYANNDTEIEDLTFKEVIELCRLRKDDIEGADAITKNAKNEMYRWTKTTHKPSNTEFRRVLINAHSESCEYAVNSDEYKVMKHLEAKGLIWTRAVYHDMLDNMGRLKLPLTGPIAYSGHTTADGDLFVKNMPSADAWHEVRKELAGSGTEIDDLPWDVVIALCEHKEWGTEI